jgi:hypothetical protein
VRVQPGLGCACSGSLLFCWVTSFRIGGEAERTAGTKMRGGAKKGRSAGESHKPALAGSRRDPSANRRLSAATPPDYAPRTLHPGQRFQPWGLTPKGSIAVFDFRSRARCRLQPVPASMLNAKANFTLLPSPIQLTLAAQFSAIGWLSGSISPCMPLLPESLTANVEHTLGPRLDDIEQRMGITPALAAAG